MAKPTKKHKSLAQQHSALVVTIVAALAASFLILALSLFASTRNNNSTGVPPLKSKPAYVDGASATDHVANFYKQYIDPGTTSSFRAVLISGYGDRNLTFYSQYYLHGFDPITCSTTMPSKVSASLVSTGPVANVNATEYFADGTRLTVKAIVVLSNKLAIDSITCPGAQGNLPPAT